MIHNPAFASFAAWIADTAVWLATHATWLILGALVALVGIASAILWFVIARTRQRIVQQQANALAQAAAALQVQANNAVQQVNAMQQRVAGAQQNAAAAQGSAAAAQQSAEAANTTLTGIQTALAGDFGRTLQRLGETVGGRPGAEERRETEDQELRVAGVAATIELTKAGFQALIVINGGAIVALLALLGSIWTASPTSASQLVVWLAGASALFGLGLTCAIVGIGEAFRAQRKTQARVDKYREMTATERRKEEEKLRALAKRCRKRAYWIGAGSVVLFGIGAIVVMAGLLLSDKKLALACPADAVGPCTISCPDGTAIVVDAGHAISIAHLTEGIFLEFPEEPSESRLLAPRGTEICEFRGFGAP